MMPFLHAQLNLREIQLICLCVVLWPGLASAPPIGLVHMDGEEGNPFRRAKEAFNSDNYGFETLSNLTQL